MVVLQQNNTLLCDLLFGSQISRVIPLFGLALIIAKSERIVKQPELEFLSQDASNGIVDKRNAYLSITYQPGQVLDIASALHIHIAPRSHGLPRRLVIIDSKTMRDHLADRIPVADGKSFECPIPFQDVPLQINITGSRYPVEA